MKKIALFICMVILYQTTYIHNSHAYCVTSGIQPGYVTRAVIIGAITQLYEEKKNNNNVVLLVYSGTKNGKKEHDIKICDEKELQEHFLNEHTSSSNVTKVDKLCDKSKVASKYSDKEEVIRISIDTTGCTKIETIS